MVNNKSGNEQGVPGVWGIEGFCYVFQDIIENQIDAQSEFLISDAQLCAYAHSCLTISQINCALIDPCRGNQGVSLPAFEEYRSSIFC
jgi:hypothetical protein